MTSSFILTRREWEFALSGEGDGLSLAAKGLASLKADGGVALGAELRLVSEEARLAAAAEIAPGAIALRGSRFCLLVEPYPLAGDTLKIALYKDEAALCAAMRERSTDSDKAAD